MVSQSARGRTLRAVMLAGMLSMLAALACMTLLASQSSGRVALEEFLVEPQQQQLWLGEHWYISGLEDDGKYMVPEAADPESSGNALFDFGSADGTPTDPDTRLPAGGKTEVKSTISLCALVRCPVLTERIEQFWVPADGEVPGHFDIEAIRKNEDGKFAFAKLEMNPADKVHALLCATDPTQATRPSTTIAFVSC